MILVDTSVWIDHLHRSDRRLAEALDRDDVGSHPYVIEELALGTIKRRDDILRLLENLSQFPVIGHFELMGLAATRRLWGRGLSAVDAHLLGSVLLVRGAELWTRDRRLTAACSELGVPLFHDQREARR